jgi:hypothetical protein
LRSDAIAFSVHGSNLEEIHLTRDTEKTKQFLPLITRMKADQAFTMNFNEFFSYLRSSA